MISRSIPVIASGIISFFLQMSNIPLHIHHVVFIHSPVHGHLGCFHVLAIVTIAAVNTGLHLSFQIIVFSRYMTRSGIALRNNHTK